MPPVFYASVGIVTIISLITDTKEFQITKKRFFHFVKRRLSARTPRCPRIYCGNLFFRCILMIESSDEKRFIRRMTFNSGN